MAVAIVGVVVAAIGAISGFMGANAAAKIDNAKNNATRITNQANNEYRVAAAALQNYIRSEQNNRILKVAGENYNTLAENVTRTLDDSVRGSSAKRLVAAEAIGTMAAASAGAGVGGGTTEMLNSTFRRAVAFSQQADEEKVQYAVNDMQRQRTNQISNAVASMDQGTTFAQTQGVYLADTKVNAFGYALQGFANALPYIDTMMQQRAAARTAPATNTSSAPQSTNSITFL